MEFYYTLFCINSCLLAFLIIFKTYFFFSRSQAQQFAEWLYFDKHSIYTSHSDKVEKEKRRQNALSVIILLLVILDLLLLLMWHIS